ncbi:MULTISPECIES: hypothetical protein [Weissella]|uniref:hypothetical protein n=1 Tax=Weissella TaxID=46255 RepID=UPI0002191996|nr:MULTISPECIES: hypothetical protein [Weissella]APS27866.1 hypothetical protein AUC63_01870 [Weissella cibaria]APU63265.1 hypothetical protein AUC65_01477 [Weissella cibaria]APU65415.1 hypothetical protein AUC62_01469 [Weissella cibaria]ASS51208.1 hypothetical protein CHR48_00214 [Weissella cibaria]KXU03965.1 Phage protein [Weissella sp. DD23]
MPKPYIITYDLNEPGKKYDDVAAAIKSSARTWTHYLESTFIITSDLSADQIQKNIKPYLDNNDALFISELAANNHQGWLNRDQWDYLREHVF